jgi:hypothetical protein
LREPLLHFLLLGAALFLVFEWRGAPSVERIVITPAQIDSFSTGFVRRWSRPPSEAELKALVDEHVREEIAVRETRALGLDRDDTVIRRRLRQKFDFLADEAADAAAPTDAQLLEWMQAHAEQYRREAQASFRQVVLSAELRGAALESDAQRLLDRLVRAGPDANVESLGDVRMLATEVGLSRRSTIVREYGEAFAAGVFAAEPGKWSGPIRSGYGLHLVMVRTQDAGESLALADVRPLVERDFLVDRSKRAVEQHYARLLSRYQVVVEGRAEGKPQDAAAAKAAAR